jgi:polar amino acid transport system substrate-binding protein
VRTCKSGKWIFVAALGALFFAGGCGKSGGKKAFSTLADFNGAKIASQAGAAFPHFIDPVIPNVRHEYINSLPEIIAALSSGKADAAAVDMPIAMRAAAQHPDLAVFPETVAEDRYGFAVAKGSRLGALGNGVLARLKEDGTLDELKKFWLSADDGAKKLPTLLHNKDYDGSGGTIMYGCAISLVPMSYINSTGKPAGFELDVVNRMAYELNMKVRFFPMPFAELLPALLSGKADMVGGSMSMTEERMKSVDFIGPNFDGGVVLLIKRERLGVK